MPQINQGYLISIPEASKRHDINNLRSPNTQNEILAISPDGGGTEYQGFTIYGKEEILQ